MPLKVIGAGLGRTGTMSLKLALEELGFGPCYHMSEVAQRPDAFAWWVEAADGKPDWERIFDGYQSTTDYPACSFWRELAAAYPDAPVILSVREPAKWFESVAATIFSPPMNAHLSASPLKTFFEKCVWQAFGPRIRDRDFMIEAFNRHVDTVKREIPPERLLVYEAKEGWEPLCRFLGVPVPAAPYPRANTREDFLNLILPAIGTHGLVEAAKGLAGASAQHESVLQEMKARGRVRD